MSCSNCGNGTPKGCKSNGNCSNDRCGKLDVFDWLSDIQLPDNKTTFDFVEIRFKN